MKKREVTRKKIVNETNSIKKLDTKAKKIGLISEHVTSHSFAVPSYDFFGTQNYKQTQVSSEKYLVCGY